MLSMSLTSLSRLKRIKFIERSLVSVGLQDISLSSIISSIDSHDNGLFRK